MREVVAAVIVVDGKLLLGQRVEPAWAAGKWELPGGKVRDGEPPADAIRRELQEELGVFATAGERFGPDVPVPGDMVLRAYLTTIVGTPRPLVHAELRWVDATELGTIDLLDSDRTWLPALRALLP